MGNFCKFRETEELEIVSQSEKEYSKNEFKEIKDFRKEILEMNVFKRKEIANEKYQKFIENTVYYNNDIDSTNEIEIKDKYIQIVCLLLIDNTNKNIVILYLNFIKKYSNFIKKYKLIPYEKELQKYKIIFTIDEMEAIEKNIKTKSQRDIFLDYIKYLSSVNFQNNEIQLLKQTKNQLDKLYLFNTPIEFENEELYYYKCLYNLLFDISSQINDGIYYIQDYLKNKQNVIKYITRKQLYNKEQIISNEDKMNLLYLYLSEEYFKAKYNENDLTNFNRLKQETPVTIKDFNEFNKGNKRNILIDINKITHIAHRYDSGKKGAIYIPLSDVCLQNLNNSYFEGKSEVQYYYNLDSLLIENEINIYIKDIRNFLIKIINSKVFKQALKELFPKYYNYLILNNNEEMEQYIKERIKFYPFEDLSISGITDKLSCYSFIPSINFQFDNIKKGIKLKKINNDTYKVSLTIINSLHEIIHAEQDIIFFKGSNKDLILSPKRKVGKDEKGNDKEIKEGGTSFEYLLFGKEVGKIDFLQCLYILNEKNYDQSLEEFRENFQNINKLVKDSEGDTKFIKTEDGIFKKFYINSTEVIEDILNELKLNPKYIFPKMSIGKRNLNLEDDEDDEDYLPRRKCGLIGGSKKIYEISKK